MSKEIYVKCPGCEAGYTVPAAFCGEVAECDECKQSFTIINPEEDPKVDLTLPSTDTGAIDADAIKTTHTVKLSRSGIGMIPEINDNFQLGVHKSSGDTQKTIKKSKPDTVSRPKRNKNKKTEIKIPEWTKIDVESASNIIGLKEGSDSPWKIPLMVCIPVLIAGIIGIVLVKVAGIAIAIIAVLVIAAVAFAIAPKDKKALVVTDSQSICIVGKDRMEINHQ